MGAPRKKTAPPRRTPPVYKPMVPGTTGGGINPGTTGTPVAAGNAGAGTSSNAPGNIRINTGIDWRNMLATDPEMTSGLLGLNTTLGAAGTRRQSSIRSALVQQGIRPGETLAQWEARIGGDPFDDINEDTFREAQNNPHAIWRRLEEAYKDNLTQSRNTFEDRGFADSGFRVSGDEYQGLQYNRADTDAVNAFTNLVTGAMGEYTGALGAHQTGTSELTGRVSGRLQNDPTLQATAEANLVEGSADTYGENVYRSADGRLWKQDGTLFTGSPRAPAPPPAPPVFVPPSAPPPPPGILETFTSPSGRVRFQ